MPARRLVQRALAPVERFLHVEASSGIVLLVVAVIALVWANSPWGGSYAALWHLPLGFRLGHLAFERDLHFWVNEGLMTIFFFVVGLEIRREIDRGELSEVKRAALPFAAALGGMIAPAILFFSFNRGHASVHGWGTPMATDIAFAVGVLTLLGKRVPPALRVLLLSLAVIDDVGAILVIALFYSSNLAGVGFEILAIGFLAMIGQKRLGVRNPWAYVPAAAIAWSGAYVAGIHPTLSGVVVGLMTPATAWLGREAVSPLERIVHALHPWVAFGIMPLFALANAGVPLGSISLSGDAARVFAGVGVGLVLGKPLGILGLTWVAVRLGIAALPRGVTVGQLAMVGCVAGIGFTMALFIAQLAFDDKALLETAKLAVLAASGVAGVLGTITGLFVLPKEPDAGAAKTEAEAESRTEV